MQRATELDVAENVEYTVAERVKEGIDKVIERTGAELVQTQVRMHMTEAEGAVDILRTRLSQNSVQEKLTKQWIDRCLSRINEPTHLTDPTAVTDPPR